MNPGRTKREQLVKCKKHSSIKWRNSPIKWSWLQIKMQNQNSVPTQHFEGFSYALITTCIEMKTKHKPLKEIQIEFLPSGQLYGKDQLFFWEARDKGQNFYPWLSTYKNSFWSFFINSRKRLLEVSVWR